MVGLQGKGMPLRISSGRGWYAPHDFLLDGTQSLLKTVLRKSARRGRAKVQPPACGIDTARLHQQK